MSKQLKFYKNDQITRTAYFYKTVGKEKFPYVIPVGAVINAFFPNSVQLSSATPGEITFTAGESKCVYTIPKAKSTNFVASDDKQDIVFVVQEDGTANTEQTFVEELVLSVLSRPNGA